MYFRIFLFFKSSFRNLNYYTLPSSILFIFRKRLNLIAIITIFFFFLIFNFI